VFNAAVTSKQEICGNKSWEVSKTKQQVRFKFISHGKIRNKETK
jgi:hypothetical protein